MVEGKPVTDADEGNVVSKSGDVTINTDTKESVADKATDAFRDELQGAPSTKSDSQDVSDTDQGDKAESNPLFEDVHETEILRAKQQDVKAVQPGLDKLLSQFGGGEPDAVDVDQVKEKITQGKVDELTVPELRKAIELEARDADFAKMSGFKATEHANKILNQSINDSVISANVMLSVYQLRQRPGNPIGLPTIATDANDPTSGYAQRPETFDVLSANGEIDQAKVAELIKSGKLTRGLNLEPSGIPTPEEITNMQNSMEFLSLNQGRIVEAHQRMEAHGKYKVISDILGIDKPGWKPPEDTSDLSSYNARSGEAINLVFSVRNYAEAMQTLNNIGGDFKTEALKDFPGKLTWGGKDGKTIVGMDLDLPDSLEQSPENERKFQKLRDWIEKYGGPVDQAMKDYEKGSFIRYGDIITEGKIELDADGNPIRVKNGDAAGTTMTLVNKDGKTFNLSMRGEMLDSQGNPPESGELENLAPRAKTEDFDYINQKFDVKTLPNGDIQVSNNRHFYGDHLLNYQHWFGDYHGTVDETRTYKPDDYVAVQTQTGKVEMVRADRLQEWKDVQAFFHHGGKIASTALDVGMIATGGMGAAGFVLKGAGTGIGFAANLGRVALGAGGLLDPTFRQMGETGEVLRKARHYAILLDVTQGLARQGIGAVSGGRLALYGKGAQEVQGFIESSATLSKVDTATRYAFGAADAVWLPLIGREILDKRESYSGDTVDKAHRQYGTGSRNLFGSGFVDDAGERKVDPAEAARTTFDVYNDMTGDTGPAKGRFARALDLIKNGDSDTRASERNDNLITLFQPSADQLQNWRKTHGHKSATRVQPGEIENPENPVDNKEKVTAAISLLFLAQEDGKLPEDGVLARRSVEVPGYQYQEVVSGGQYATTVTRDVAAETINQEVTVDDVVDTLKRATLDSSEPGTQLIAADALYRTGAISTAKYAGVVLDVLENSGTNDGNRELKMKALRQLSDLHELKKIEEVDPTKTGMTAEEYKADSYGFSSGEIAEKLSKYVKSESDPDVRAMATSVLLASEHPERSKVIAENYESWQKSKDNPGQFRQEFVTRLNADLERPLPKDGDIKTFDQARATKLRAAMALGHLDDATGEADYTQKINQALIETITFDGSDSEWYKWDSQSRPDIGITMHAFNELVPKMGELSEAQQKILRQTGLDIVQIEPSRVNPRANQETKDAQTKDLQETAQARLLVIGQADKLFANSNDDIRVKAQARKFEASINSNLTDESINSGWGQYPEMRVAAIKGLTSLGTIDNKSVGLILNRLNFDTSKTGTDSFYEGVPHVRSAALEAIQMLGREEVLRDPTKNGLPEHFNVTEMLKRERDNAVAGELWNIWERGDVRQDPNSIEAVYDYQTEVKRMQSSVNTDGVIDDLMNLAKQNPSKFGRLAQTEDDLEDVARKRAEDSWSWFGSEFAYWITGNHESAEQEVFDKENPKLLAEREQHFENLYGNFAKMSEAEQEIALKTFLHVIEGGPPKLFDKDHEADNIVDSARYLEGLARRDDNNDIVKDKDLLGRVIVSALLNNKKLDPRAKEHLLGALDHITAKPGEQGFNSGTRSDDYTVLSPFEAGAVYTQVLSDEGSRGAPNEDTPRWKKQASERVQLEAINKIHELRFHGAYSELAALGPDARLDASNPGSPYAKVRERAREVHDSLLNGVGWIYNDTPGSLTASDSQKATAMESAIMNGDTNNYEEAVKGIFRSMNGAPITSETDPRRRALKQGMNHPSNRVKLASSWMLSQSAVESDFKDSASVLADLAVNATEAAVQKEASGLLKAMIENGGDNHQEIAREAWQTAYDQRGDTNHPAERPPGEITPLQKAQSWYRNATNSERSLVASLPMEQKKAVIMDLTGMTEAEVEAGLVPPPVMDRRSLDIGLFNRGFIGHRLSDGLVRDPLYLLHSGANIPDYSGVDFRNPTFRPIELRTKDTVGVDIEGTDIRVIDPRNNGNDVLPSLTLGPDGKYQIVLDNERGFTLDSGTRVSVNPDNTFSFKPPSQLGSVEDFQEFLKFVQATNPQFKATDTAELANQYMRYLARSQNSPIVIDSRNFNRSGRIRIDSSGRIDVARLQPDSGYRMDTGRALPVFNAGPQTTESQIASWVQMKQARLGYRQQRIDSMLNDALTGGNKTRVELERPEWNPASKVEFSRPAWVPESYNPDFVRFPLRVELIRPEN